MRFPSSTNLMPPLPETSPRAGGRWFEVGFWLLAIGLSTGEGLCTAGLAIVLIGALRDRSAFRWDEWKPLWIWLLWALVAPAVLGHRMPTGTGVARLVDWLGVPAAAFGFSRLSMPARRRVLAAAAVTLVLSCVAAGLQHYGAWPSQQALGWTHVNWARVYEPAKGGSERFLGGGLVAHRLKFAHFGSLVVLVLAVAGQVDRRTRWWTWTSAAAGFLSIWLFPGARMAAMALTVAVALAGVLMARRRRRALKLAGLFGLITAVMMASVPMVRERFIAASKGGGGGGDGDRKDLVRAGLEAVKDSPLVGVGLDRFRLSAYGLNTLAPELLAHPGKSHLQLLSVAAEQGIVGAGLFAWALWMLARRGMRTKAGAAATATLGFFLLLGLAHDPLFHAPFSMGLAVIVGAALGAGQRETPQAVRPSAGT
jgi:O-antigen ligase